MRWSKFKHLGAPQEMYDLVAEHVFPWMRALNGQGTSYTRHMKDARFTIPTSALLAKVVDLIEAIPMDRPRHQGRPL